MLGNHTIRSINTSNSLSRRIIFSTALNNRLKLEGTSTKADVVLGLDTNLTAEAKAELLAKLDQRIDSLIRKGIRQAGFSDTLATHAELDWRASGFWPGTALATHYAVGDQHRRYRRLHVHIIWRNAEGTAIPVTGPICIGSSKFSGMGLFAASQP